MKLHQPLAGAAESLFEYSQTIPTIDTHEHVSRRESDYLSQTIRFGHLFNPYVSNDLASAGMPFPRGVWAAFHCIADDWDAFEPYWKSVRHGSYARPLRLALQKFYGVDDFTRENWSGLVEEINRRKTPGIYKRIFQDACGIEKAIVCAGDLPDRDDPILRGNISAPCMQILAKPAIDKMAAEAGAPQVSSLDELLEVNAKWMETQVAAGAMEFKTKAMPVETPTREAAEPILKRILAGEKVTEDEGLPLCAFARDADAKKAAELDVPLAIHTGVWGDFRRMSVSDLIGFIQRNPDTRMDIYHLGIPTVREAIQIVKNFPNAWLNLCWSHVVASDMVVQSLKEAIDMVPMNKIFAFGADYVLFIEKVYGHLHVARENVAIALGDRVDRNLMDLDEAKAILKAWFYDNPKGFYRV